MYLEYKNAGTPIKDWKASEYADKIKELESYQQNKGIHTDGF